MSYNDVKFSFKGNKMAIMLRKTLP